MRAASYLVMVALVSSAIAVGELRLALVAGGVKTLIVGLEFMELRRAAHPHMLGFVAGAIALTSLLVLLG